MITSIWKGAAMAEWLSSLLAEQEVRGSIPRLATWISEIGYLLLPNRDMAEIPLERRKSSIQPTYQLVYEKEWKFMYIYLTNDSKVIRRTDSQTDIRTDSGRELVYYSTAADI